jgi:hypothetical protein
MTPVDVAHQRRARWQFGFISGGFVSLGVEVIVVVVVQKMVQALHEKDIPGTLLNEEWRHADRASPSSRLSLEI